MSLRIKAFILCFFTTISLFSQDDYDYTALNVPPSPEAEAFANYANLEISEYTGTPGISVPLYTLQGDDLSLPVSLNYNPTGIKVDEYASRVGLGWTLNAGGLITRSTKGAHHDEYYCHQCVPEDDDTQGGGGSNRSLYGYFWNGNTVAAPFENDSEPDMFFYNFAGYSGKFVFEQISQTSRTIRSIPHNNLKIDYELSPNPSAINAFDVYFSKFEITTPEGVKYTFDEIERTRPLPPLTSGLNYPKIYASSWYLSKVKNINTGEEINITYTTIAEFEYDRDILESSPFIVTNQNEKCDCPGNKEPEVATQYRTEGAKIIDKISSKYDEVQFSIADRTDLPGDKHYTELTVNRGGSRYKRFDFEQDYFYSPRSGRTHNRQRLKLKAVKEYGETDSASKPAYKFTYNEAYSLPVRHSHQQDIWGYYNRNFEDTSIPKLWVYPDLQDGEVYSPYPLGGYAGQEIIIDGADRRSNEAAMKTAVLEKIEFPTGGYVQYGYGMHEFNYRQSTLKGGGLRIESITLNSAPSRTRTFTYKYNGSGHIVNMPQFAYLCKFPPSGANLDDWFNDNTVVQSGLQSRAGTTSGSHIGYEKVSVVHSGNGKTEYEFSSPLSHPDPDIDYFFDASPPCGDLRIYDRFPFPSAPGLDHKRGLLLKQKDYAESGDLVREIENEYDTIFQYSFPIRVYRLWGGQRTAETTRGSLYEIISDYVYLEKSTSREYGTNGGAPVVLETNYVVDPTYLLPTRIGRTNLADQSSQVTSIFYPFNAPGEPNAQAMMNRNMFGIPLIKEESGLTVRGIKTEYQFFGGILLPKKIFSKRGGSWYQESVINAYNGVLPISVNRGPDNCYPTETYIWQGGLLQSKNYVDFDWVWAWDGKRRLTSYTDQNNQKADYKYDGLHRLKEVTQRNGKIITDTDYGFKRDGHNYNFIKSTTTYADGTDTQAENKDYDGLGRFLKMTKLGYSPEGDDVVWDEVEYDEMGRTAKKLYLPGAYTTYEYELSPLDRMIKQINPDGNFKETIYGSNFGGETDFIQSALYRTEVIDENGNPTINFADFLGRTVQVTDALDGKLKYKFHTSGQPEKITTPAGEIYGYSYDPINRLDSKTIPGGGTTTFGYDDDCKNLPNTVTDANGTVLTKTYDDHDRPLLTTEPVNGTVQQYVYEQNKTWLDKEYNLIMTRDNNGDLLLTDYTMDDYGRVDYQLQQHPNGPTRTWFTYNDADKVVRDARLVGTYPIKYDFDYDNGLRLTHKGVLLQDIYYVPIHDFFYNRRDEVTTKTVSISQKMTFPIEYQYNKMGWVTKINRGPGSEPFALKCDQQIVGVGGGDGEFKITEEATEDLGSLLDLIAQGGGEIDIGNQNPCVDTVKLPCASDTLFMYNPDYVRSLFTIRDYFDLGDIGFEVTNYNSGEHDSYIVDNDPWVVDSFIENRMFEADWLIEKQLPAEAIITSFYIDVTLAMEPRDSVQIGVFGGGNWLPMYGSPLKMIGGPGTHRINFDRLPSVNEMHDMIFGMLLPCTHITAIDGIEVYFGYMCEDPEDPCEITGPGCSPSQAAQQATEIAAIKSRMAANNADVEYPVDLLRIKLCDGSFEYLLESEAGQLTGNFSVTQRVTLNAPGESFQTGDPVSDSYNSTEATDILNNRASGIPFTIDGFGCNVTEEKKECEYKIEQENWDYEVVDSTDVRISYEYYVTETCGGVTTEIFRTDTAKLVKNARDVFYGSGEDLGADSTSYIDYLMIHTKNPDRTIRVDLNPATASDTYNVPPEDLYYPGDSYSDQEPWMNTITYIIQQAIENTLGTPCRDCYNLSVTYLGAGTIPKISFGITHNPTGTYVAIDPANSELRWVSNYGIAFTAQAGSIGAITYAGYDAPCGKRAFIQYYHNLNDTTNTDGWFTTPLPPSQPPVATTESLLNASVICTEVNTIVSYCDIPIEDCTDGDCNECPDDGPNPNCTTPDMALQEASMEAVIGARRNQDPNRFEYPTYMYAVKGCDNAKTYIMQEELGEVDGGFFLDEAVEINGPDHPIKCTMSNGTVTTIPFDVAYADIMTNQSDDISSMSDPNIPPKFCDDTPPNCDSIQVAEQNASFRRIQDSLRNLDLSTLSYPTTLYAITMCDGSQAYVMGDMIDWLDGDYTINTTILVGSPRQQFRIIKKYLPRSWKFGENISYYNGGVHGGEGQKNGNIAAVEYPGFSGTVAGYGYYYDKINRLVQASYGESTLLVTGRNPHSGNPILTETISPTHADRYAVPHIKYDADGNIGLLLRKGMIEGAHELDGNDFIDQLSYTYKDNRLVNVEDSAPEEDFQPEGFPKKKADYTYDSNGNVLTDEAHSKNFQYSYLNLPTDVSGTEIWYDASGKNWRKGHRYYSDGLIFNGNEKFAFVHDEGRVVFNPPEGGPNRYELAFKDHLGNSRSVVADFDGDGKVETLDDPNTGDINERELIERLDYYPFGMTHNRPCPENQPLPHNTFQYNYKEFMGESLGIPYYDYHARWYEPSIGRFGQIDPKAEHSKLVASSPYVYTVNNPIRHNDPSGECPPWICGAVAGALVEAGSQYLVNVYNGQGYLEAVKNIDGADVLAAGIEGGITGGGSVARRLLVKGTAMVVSEAVQASVDVELNGDIDYLGKEGSEKSVEQVITDTGIGIASGVAGNSVETGLDLVTNSKAKKQITKVTRELKKSAKGSDGEAGRIAQKASLKSTIKGNEKVAEGAGTFTTESIDNKYKN